MSASKRQKTEHSSAPSDVRVKQIRPLLPPACLDEMIPIPEAAAATVARGRTEVAQVLDRQDDRLIVICGPCSIHDTKAGIEYAEKLKVLAEQHAADLLVVMRVYFEKPRTTIGWKGLINDPDLDGSFNINAGLQKARKFLIDVNALGLPAGTEFLDTVSPQYCADLISWGAIGARTTECVLLASS
jgi:3-deoxy-7-phosphoheptulonate synthase